MSQGNGFLPPQAQRPMWQWWTMRPHTTIEHVPNSTFYIIPYTLLFSLVSLHFPLHKCLDRYQCWLPSHSLPPFHSGQTLLQLLSFYLQRSFKSNTIWDLTHIFWIWEICWLNSKSLAFWVNGGSPNLPQWWMRCPCGTPSITSWLRWTNVVKW